jgi:hypothetical protein
VAALAVVAVFVVSSRVVGFTTDSDSYVDVAENIRSGAGFVQTIVDFWRPAVPDPLGLWPPLYPTLVAIVSAFGVPPESAALGVSGVSFVLFAFAFALLARRVLEPVLAFGVAILAVVTLGVATCGAFAWSEATYLALSTGGLVALARIADAAPGARPRGRDALLAGALFGFAALTRYAGVPIALAAAAAGIAWRATRPVAGAFALGALVPPAAWIVRDLVVFGRAFGPELPAARADAWTRALELGNGLRWELLAAPLDRVTVLAVLALALLALGVGTAAMRPVVRQAIAGFAALALVVVWLATSTSAINAPTGRYLAPALPFVLLAAFAGLAQGAGPRSLRRGRVLGFLAVLLVTALVEDAAWWRARPARLEASLERRNERAALRLLVPSGTAPVLSDAGHAVRLATGRPAVQIPPLAYRPRAFGALDLVRWEAQGVRLAIVRQGGEADAQLQSLGARPELRQGAFVRLALPASGAR